MLKEILIFFFILFFTKGRSMYLSNTLHTQIPALIKSLVLHHDSDLHPPRPLRGQGGLLLQTAGPLEGRRVQGDLEGPGDVLCRVRNPQHLLPLCHDL